MARGLTDYLNDWGKTTPDKGPNDGGGEGGDYEYGNPYRAPMPENKDWGHDGKSGTSYGHSDDVIEKKDYQCWDDIKASDVPKGYVAGKSDGEGAWDETRQPYGSHPQALPTNDDNPVERYAKEGHAGGETGAHTGRGQPESTGGRGKMGSRLVPG
jgi:hypothetical protein